MAHICPAVLIWTDAQWVGLITKILDRLGPAVELVGVGGPPLAAIDDLAKKWGAPRQDDLRKLLLDRPCGFLLLAAGSELSPADLELAGQRGAAILALEPVAGRLEDLSFAAPNPVRVRSSLVAADLTKKRPAPPDSAPPNRLIWLPALDQSPGWLAAADAQNFLGRLRAISLLQLGPRHDASLFARLWDAWTTTLALADLPRSIDASLVGPLSQVPDDLYGLTGHLAIHARLSTHSSALIQCSDHVGRHERSVRVIGDAGQLRIDDHTYLLEDPHGHLLDPPPTAQPSDTNLIPPSNPPEKLPRVLPGAGGLPGELPGEYAALLAWHWRRILDRPQPAPRSAGDVSADRPPEHVLACCLATLLSIRTGQPETPTKILQIHKVR